MTIRLNIQTLTLPVFNLTNNVNNKPGTFFRLHKSDLNSPWLPKFEFYLYAVFPKNHSINSYRGKSVVIDHEDAAELIRLGINRRFTSYSYLCKLLLNEELDYDDHSS